eukprot:TRINITY_DN7053_c2_g1_i1.p1 TRINITY_DN7053_c2_g1~~TRINITY_DN7053_c2_g1_i1.p1  ORF type:complete len:208 (+),score=25.36 TRINITY_DN7053_c2_g1_i1:92-625(+)
MQPTNEVQQQVVSVPMMKRPLKPRRWKPGTVALRQCLQMSKSTKLVLAKAPFSRILREEINGYKTNVRVSETALRYVQEGAERYLHDRIQAAMQVTTAWKAASLSAAHFDVLDAVLNPEFEGVTKAVTKVPAGKKPRGSPSPQAKKAKVKKIVMKKVAKKAPMKRTGKKMVKKVKKN